MSLMRECSLITFGYKKSIKTKHWIQFPMRCRRRRRKKAPVWRSLKFKDWDQTQSTIQLLMPTSFHLLTCSRGRQNGPQGWIFGAKFTSSFYFRAGHGILSHLISLGWTRRSGGEGGQRRCGFNVVKCSVLQGIAPRGRVGGQKPWFPDSVCSPL